MKSFAETVVFCTYPDGSSRSVRLTVGQPRPHPDGDWTCQVSAEGTLWEGQADFAGIDSWQALTLGLTFLRRMLAEEILVGAVLHWPDETGTSTSMRSLASDRVTRRVVGTDHE